MTTPDTKAESLEDDRDAAYFARLNAAFDADGKPVGLDPSLANASEESEPPQ